MERFGKIIFRLLVLSVPALIMKKFMVPFSGLLVIAIYDSLAVFFLGKAFGVTRNDDNTEGRTVSFTVNYAIFSVCFFSLAYRMQESHTSLTLTRISFTLIAIYSFLFARSMKTTFAVLTKEEKRSMWKNIFFPMVYLLLMISFSSFTSQRFFYNFFHSNTFEEYVRKNYPEAEAYQIVQQNKRRDADAMADAQVLLSKAKTQDSLKNYGASLKLANKSVDASPDYAEAYCFRGYLKLNKSEIDKEMAESAYLDFSNAIKIKPDYADAYYQRGVVLSFLDAKQADKICNDFRKAKALNRALDISGFEKSFCKDSLR